MKLDRKDKILSILKRVKYITTSELFKKFPHFSDMTIRRDISELEKRKLIRRGQGFVSLYNYNFVNEITKPQNYDSSDKETIAKKAAALLKLNDNIFMGNSTINERIVKYVDKKINLFTNSIKIFLASIANHNIKSFIIGGQYSPKTQSVNGMLSVEFLKNINFSKIFLGANFINAIGAFTRNDYDAALWITAIQHSPKVYIVAETKKINSRGHTLFLKWDENHYLITEDSIIPKTNDIFAKWKVNLL